MSAAHHKCWAMDESLNYIDTFMRSFTLKIGFSPSSWEQITDVEILKKVGVFNVNKMRLIQLMVAEYQANNKMVGRKVIEHAEQAGVLAKDQ